MPLETITLGVLYAQNYAEHVRLLWTTRIVYVLFCCLLGRPNWEIIT